MSMYVRLHVQQDVFTHWLCWACCYWLQYMLAYEICSISGYTQPGCFDELLRAIEQLAPRLCILLVLTRLYRLPSLRSPVKLVALQSLFCFLCLFPWSLSFFSIGSLCFSLLPLTPAPPLVGCLSVGKSNETPLQKNFFTMRIKLMKNNIILSKHKIHIKTLDTHKNLRNLRNE